MQSFLLLIIFVSYNLNHVLYKPDIFQQQEVAQQDFISPQSVTRKVSLNKNITFTFSKRFAASVDESFSIVGR